MARTIEVHVPLSFDQTMTLLLQAAEALQHQVVHFDAQLGAAVIRADFSLRALSTFNVHAEARPLSTDETLLRLSVSPGFKLGAFTGIGQSQRIGWQLVGKMQQIVDPGRYRELEDEVLPSRRASSRSPADRKQ
jgi:hypothetical protein